MPGICFLCGLGNPGTEYANTRHNLGFDTLDILAGRHRLRWKGAGKKSLIASWNLSGSSITLIKPQTFMNRSGDALASFRALSPDSLMVICDDISLPLGRIRIRAGGGSGGHRGLESIAERLGTDYYARLRIGVGPAPEGAEWSDYVLSHFPEGTEERVRTITEIAADAVETVLSRGLDAACTEYNGKLLPEEG